MYKGGHLSRSLTNNPGETAMKTILAASLMLVATTVTADWEDVFKNPDLTANYQGYTTSSSVSVDPIAETYAGNSDLFAGEESGNMMKSRTASSLDAIGRKNPDLDCGCI
jgi:hypothetical protein